MLSKKGRTVIDPFIRDENNKVLGRKPEFELKSQEDKSKTRMATEAITSAQLDDIIESQIRNNTTPELAQELINNSMGDINPNADPRFSRAVINEKARLNKELVAAGIKLPHTGGLHEAIDTLGELIGNSKGTVPGPYIKSLANNREWRYHTQYSDVNEITGTREVIPFLDPSTGNVLVTKFGRDNVRKDQEHMDNRTEIVAENILKLMNLPTESRSDDGRGLSDFVVTKDNKRFNIDAMVTDAQRPNTIAIPAYTSLVPYNNYDIVPRNTYASREDKDYVVNTVKALIEEKMREPGVTGAIDAVEKLTKPTKDGRILLGSTDDSKRAGKLMRADPRVANKKDEIYHGLIVPGYKSNQLKEGYNSDNRENIRQRTTAPSNIRFVKLAQALNAANAGEGSLLYTPNQGVQRNAYLRSKVQYVMPTNRSYVTDVTETNPLTQQILDESAMRWAQRPRSQAG